MALSVSQFKTDFPEFADTPDSSVSACLARAQKYWALAVFGDLHDEVVGLQTAVFLTTSPLGFRARRSHTNADSTNMYAERLSDLLACMPRRFLTIHD